MKHTELTVRNYSGFASVVLVLGVVAVGFGAIDLLMIAPKGLSHVAATGQGDLLITGIYAFFLGVVDVFASRLAIAEGEGATERRLLVLVGALGVLMIPGQVLGIALGVVTEPVLDLLGQDPTITPLVGDYVTVRTWAIVPVVAYYVISETLKIGGLRNLGVAILVGGLAANAVLNWLFLYSPMEALFDSPETAVAAATVAAQFLMAVVGAAVLRSRLRVQGRRFRRPVGAEVVAEFRSMGRTAPGVGVRHLNDYAGSLVPILLIGTLGVPVLAAAVVATKVYTLFCRIPQACFSANFVFYGYAVGKGTDLVSAVRRLRVWSAVPTLAAAVVTVALSYWLVLAFAGDGMDVGLAQVLLLAYLLYLPAYFVEQFAGELLTVHQRGGLLSVASTVVTYAMTIPLASVAVLVGDSAFWAIASKGVSTAVLAAVFWVALRREWPAPRAVAVA